MRVTPSQFDLLDKTLDHSALKHRVVSQNVANVNTPGYRAKEVTFEGELDGHLAKGGSGNRNLEPHIREIEGIDTRADGNNVDIDKEIGKLSKNTVFYQAVSQVLASKLSTMRSAISGK